MPRSLAFARLRKALRHAVGTIPPGEVAELPQFAAALNMPPRHVAYNLSGLSDDEAALLPWRRLVPRGGDLGRAEQRSPRQKQQVALLRGEGLLLVDDRHLGVSTFRRVDEGQQGTLWADAEDD